MTKTPYLSNVIAMHDVQTLSADGSENAYPDIIFSIEQLSGERECVAVEQGALVYAANARIENTNTFTDALLNVAHSGEEFFFEADYGEFIGAFPFKAADDIQRIGFLVLSTHDGICFKTLTTLKDGSLMSNPYLMALSETDIEAARDKVTSEDYSGAILDALVPQFYGEPPEPGSDMEKQIQDSIPASAIMATIGISLLAARAEAEGRSEKPLPVLQEGGNMPRIISLDFGK